MNILRLARYAAGVSAAAAMLAACNGSQTSGSAVPGVPQQNAAMSHGSHGLPSLRVQKLMNARGLAMRMPTHLEKDGKSWMSPLAKRTQYLLYVSNVSTGQVDVFNYKSQAGNLYGHITGFSLAGGSCSDTSGNVYIIDLGAGTINEFAHGSTTKTASASYSVSEPLACSVDPTTGNVMLPGFGNGEVEIFVGGLTGSQDFVSTPYAYSEGGGYDPSGNLVIENSSTTSARSNGNVIYMEECPATCETGSSFSTISLPNQACGSPVCFMSQVMWDGHYWSLGDQAYDYPTYSYGQGNYQVSVSGSTGTVVGSAMYGTSGTNPQSDAQQIWTNGTTPAQNGITFGNLINEQEGFWNLSAGGPPKRIIPPSLTTAYYGNTVSAMKKT